MIVDNKSGSKSGQKENTNHLPDLSEESLERAQTGLSEATADENLAKEVQSMKFIFQINTRMA